MERLRQEDERKVRLSEDEIQGVLRRLRDAEMEEAHGSTVADLAEAADVSPERVAEELAKVRQERQKQSSRAVAPRRRRRLPAWALSAAGFGALVVGLNVPVGNGPLATVERVGAHRVLNRYGTGFEATRVEVEIAAHPQTLWGRLFPTALPFHSASASLFTSEGEVETIQAYDGMDYPVVTEDFTALPSGGFRTTYEYPRTAWSNKATRLHDRIDVNGKVVDLNVSLP